MSLWVHKHTLYIYKLIKHVSNKMKSLVVFQDKEIRRTWYEGEWYFSIIDVVIILTDSSRPRKYWSDLKNNLIEEGFEVSDKIGQLKLQAEDGKLRFTDCANTESMFRIIQSIPSQKAEPFKRWLAKVGYERVQEIENPELAQDRAKNYYELKGYPKDWIDKRIRGIVVRQELTEQWDKREIKDKKDYAILTNEISKATFGKSIKEHKEIKDLDPKFKNQNLRDHMTNLELIFSMLGEASTTEITKARDSKGFEECKDSSKEGGKISGNARLELEKKTGKKIVSSKNYLDIRKKKRLT